MLSWNVTGGGVRIPEREYFTPTTLHKILDKYFPHPVVPNSTGKRSSKAPPDPLLFLALEYTLLFDPEEDPIPPPRPGRMGKGKTLGDGESTTSEYKGFEDDPDSANVPVNLYSLLFVS